MNDDQLKNIIQKSSITTTENFTKDLLNKIEAKEKNKITVSVPFRKVLYSVVFLSIFIFMITYIFPINNLLKSLKIILDNRILLGLLLFFLLISINHLLRLKGSLKNETR